MKFKDYLGLTLILVTIFGVIVTLTYFYSKEKFKKEPIVIEKVIIDTVKVELIKEGKIRKIKVTDTLLINQVIRDTILINQLTDSITIASIDTTINNVMLAIDYYYLPINRFDIKLKILDTLNYIPVINKKELISKECVLVTSIIGILLLVLFD